MRSIVFRFDDPEALAEALELGSGGLVLPDGQTGKAGEWVLALFELGHRRRSTASAAQIIAGANGLLVVLEARDRERIVAFATTRSEHMRVARIESAPESRPPSPSSELPFEVTLSGRFKAASVSRVLVADADPNTGALIEEALQSLTVVIDIVRTTNDAMDLLSSMTVSLWVVGTDLEDGSGLEAIRLAKRDGHLKMPVLVVAKAPGSKLAVQAFAAGASDFIAQPFRAPELAARAVTLLSHAGVRTP